MSTAVNVKEGIPIKVVVYDIPSTSKVTELAISGQGIQFPDVLSFDYFETIYDSFVVARLSVFDSTGVFEKAFNGCGIRAFCPIEVQLYDPSKNTDWSRNITTLDFTGNNCFYVKKILNQLVQNKKQIYDIELTTRDAIASVSKQIFSTWPPDDSTKIDYNTVVEDILKNHVKTSKDTSEVTSEKTKPIAKITGHGRYSYQVIEDACRESVSLQYSPSDGKKQETGAAGYVFYQTQNKYNFHSAVKLVTASTNSISDSHIFKISIVNDSKTTAKEAAYRILNYKFNDGENTSDVYEKIKSGANATKQTNVFDTQTQTYKKIESRAPTTIVDKCEKINFGEDIKLRTYTSQSEYLIEYYNICDPDKLKTEPTHPALTSLNNAAILETFKSKSSTIRIPGNLDILAGDKIAIQVPVIQGDGSNETKISDKYSGIYVVVRLAHRLEDIKNIFTDLEICKIRES